MNQRLMVVAVLTLGLLAVAVWFGSRDPAPERASPTAMPMEPSIAAQPVPAVNAPPVQADDSAPSPWAASKVQAPILPGTGNLPPGMPAASDKAAFVQRQSDLKELEKMQMEIAVSMSDGKQADPNKVLELLAKLKKMPDAANAGVNLDAVTNNVKIAVEMQALAQKIEHESGKPGEPERKTLLGYVEQLKKLQSQLRTDVSVPRKPDSMVLAK